MRRILTMVLATGVAGCNWLTYTEGRSPTMAGIEARQPSSVTLAAARFAYDDFGGISTDTLKTNAFPWKPVTTALVLDEHARSGVPISGDTLRSILVRYGWLYPQHIANWPEAPVRPADDKPIGMVSVELRRSIPSVRLEVANIGCAACHTGPTYDATGSPTRDVWIGAPNTSRNFDGYLAALLVALRYLDAHPDETLAAIPTLYPDVSDAEMKTIRSMVLPEVHKRLAAIGSGGLTPFGNGAPGITNGVAALKARLDVQPTLLTDHEHAYASIPELYARGLRSSFSYDGAYALDPAQRFVERTWASPTPVEAPKFAGIVAFFTVPTMGLSPDQAPRHFDEFVQMTQFLYGYTPQPFPGPIDADKAARGAAVFDERCAGCHGKYTISADGSPKLVSFPNKLILQDKIGTDPTRWREISHRMVKVMQAGGRASVTNPDRSEGYTPPILGGIWSSAPYFHNGSVPTLWHVLHPEARPQKFMVGGQRLDFAKVGIAGEIATDGVYRYPANYTPWSEPVIVDTTQPGLDNHGHESKFEKLSEADKDELLEYLKRL